jgi:hypothetical protein
MVSESMVRRPKGGGKHTIPVMKESLCQDKVHRVQDKVLHCSALYGIIVLTKTNYHPTRRREQCSYCASRRARRQN